LALDDSAALREKPDCIDTEGPPGPTVVDPLSPPGPVVIVVEFDEDELPDLLDLLVVSFCAMWHGLLLSTTIVVPPLSPVTIDTLAPPALVLVVLSANAPGAISRKAPAPAINVLTMNARIFSLLRPVPAR
jgi:hypothetical protein